MSNILIINGTARKNSKSSKIAEYINEMLGTKLSEHEYNVADVAALQIAGDGSEQKNEEYSEMLEWADSLLILLPEYNHSFSGSLKRLIDSELERYKGLKCGLVGISAGNLGGVRAVESFIPVAKYLGMELISEDFYISDSYNIVKDDNVLLDDDKLIKFVKKIV